MSTIREQIVQAVVAALTTGRPAGVPAPVRTRIDSPDAGQLPALTVYQALEKVEPMLDGRAGRSARGPIVRRTLDLEIEVLTKAGAGDQADKAADPILAWVSKTIASAGCFAGLTNEADEVGTKFEYETHGESCFCRAAMTVRFEFDTLIDDPEKIQ